MLWSRKVTAVALTVLSLAACSSDPAKPAVAPSAPTNTPSTPQSDDPPPPEPQTAKIGQAIRVTEYDQEKVAAHDSEPWAVADITVASAKTAASDPEIPQRFLPPGKVYVAVTLRTTVLQGKFVLDNQHFTLVAPDGTTYPETPNGVYRKDHFRPLFTSAATERSTTPPGSGTLLYEVPSPGLPANTHLRGELTTNHPFTWQLS